MSRPVQDAPLLPFIRRILVRKGYSQLAFERETGSSRYMKVLGSGSLSAAFYVVSANEVEKRGVMPTEKPVSHAQFVTDNVRYLFK